MAITTSAREIVNNAKMDFPDDLPEELWSLVERYRGELINQAFTIVGNLSDAEDVVQESFCEAFRHRARLGQERSIIAWLRTINRANALNRVRGRKRDSNRMIRKQREAPDRAMTTGGFGGLELCESVARAIETLPDNLRAAVVYRYWEHLSYDEIAQRLQVSPRAVRRLFHDASVHLYKKLSSYLESPSGAETGDHGHPSEQP